MTGRQLADRMGVSQSAVAQLEQSEVNGLVRLNTLRRAAHALRCDLVYLLVPRTSLAEAVVTRARFLAEFDSAQVDRTMRLEQQGLSPAELEWRNSRLRREAHQHGPPLGQLPPT
jgi:predicted DNA-binding mobile mystery protein A